MTTTRSTEISNADAANVARIRIWRASVQKFLHGSKRILKAHGVSTRAYHAMLEIWAGSDDGGLSIGELARLIHLRHNSAVGVADQLCKKRLATRSRDPRDKRVVHLQLTADGLAILVALVNDHLRELSQISGNLRKVLS